MQLFYIFPPPYPQPKILILHNLGVDEMVKPKKKEIIPKPSTDSVSILPSQANYTSLNESELSGPNHEISNVDSTLDQEDKFYLSLGHEIRRKIIKYLGIHQIAGFTELKQESQASTGTVYHHLDVLSEMISQNEKKKYILSPLGIRAYKFLTQNLETLEKVKNDKEKEIKQHSTKFDIEKYLLLGSLTQIMSKNEKKGFIVTLCIVFANALCCSLFDIQAYLFFYLPSPAVSSELIPWLKPLEFLGFIVGFSILFILCELLCWLFFQKRENWKGFLQILGIPYIPMLCYLLLFGLLQNIPGFLNSIPNKILMILFQIWSMLLLAKIISQTKFLKFERGLIIAIFIDYGIFMLLLLFRYPII